MLESGNLQLGHHVLQREQRQDKVCILIYYFGARLRRRHVMEPRGLPALYGSSGEPQMGRGVVDAIDARKAPCEGSRQPSHAAAEINSYTPNAAAGPDRARAVVTGDV